MGIYLQVLCITSIFLAVCANPAPPRAGVVDFLAHSRPVRIGNRQPVGNREAGDQGVPPAAAAEGDVPAAEGDAPAAEGDAPAAGGDPPAAEGDAPAAEGDTPDADGEAPAADGEAPAADGEAPTAEGEIRVTDTVHCTKEVMSEAKFHWSSPNFGVGDYPNDAYCKVSSSSAEPGYATISFNNLDVLCESRGDIITFKQAFHIEDLGSKQYCGVMSETNQITSILPSYNFFAKFRTDHTGTASGFNVTVTKGTTDCHRVINAGEQGNTGIIETPGEPNAGSAKICEWWIRAPYGKRIELQFIPSLTNPPVCDEGSILVDNSGSKFYRRRNTDSYCGKSFPGTILSKKNYLNVLYFSYNARDHFTARWAMVSDF